MDIVNKLRMCLMCNDYYTCLIVLNQWADCGKHDLQEAKKLEIG